MNRFLLILILCYGAVPGFSQKRMAASIPDGGYLDNRSFLMGRPDLGLEDFVLEWFVSYEDDYGRCVLKRNEKIMVQSPLVICIKGDCFINDPGRSDASILYFAKLTDIGAICLYRRQMNFTEWIPMKVFNPVSGKPYMQGRIPRNQNYMQWYMWRPIDGENRQLDRRSYSEWTGFEMENIIREQDMIQGVRTFNLIRPVRSNAPKDN